MGTERNQANSGRGFWRSLISAVAIYALVAQPLLIAIVGTQLAQAAALDDALLSQLCLHQSDGSPVSPADQQKHPADDHCLLCFAGAFHLLGAPDPTTVTSIDPEIRKLRQAARSARLTRSFLYSVARPRGPPFNA
jgi:Protein of unknown function (DUF2946)